MADLTIIFTGLILFTTASQAVMVTGDIEPPEVHLPVLTIDAKYIAGITGKDVRNAKGGIHLGLNETTIVQVAEQGVDSAPLMESSFKENVPSVSEALAGAGDKVHTLVPCAIEVTPKCKNLSGSVRMSGGSLSAEKASHYRFLLEDGRGEYKWHMAHTASWSGKASAITISKGKNATTVKLNAGAKVIITNEPEQKGASRHFGIFRHLWGMSNNRSQDGFPLPYRDSFLMDLRKALQNPDDRAALKEVFAVIRGVNRPIFCPVARQ